VAALESEQIFTYAVERYSVVAPSLQRFLRRSARQQVRHDRYEGLVLGD
jgi:hypothetical protein